MPPRWIAATVTTALVVAGPALAGPAAPGSPPASAGWEYLGEFEVTYYWTAVEDERYRGLARDQALLDVEGCEIARVAADFRRRLDLEGCGRLADGRVLSVAARAGDGWRYVDLGPAHWGLGAGDVPLVPLRSLAADPALVGRGTRLHLPAFAGLPLPDGSPHGGGFLVDDVGSSIRGLRLDVFIGDEARLAELETRVPSHRKTAVYRRRPQAVHPLDLLAAER